MSGRREVCYQLGNFSRNLRRNKIARQVASNTAFALITEFIKSSKSLFAHTFIYCKSLTNLKCLFDGYVHEKVDILVVFNL